MPHCFNSSLSEQSTAETWNKQKQVEPVKTIIKYMFIFGDMNRKENFEDLATAQVSRAQTRRKRLAPLGRVDRYVLLIIITTYNFFSEIKEISVLYSGI